MIIENKTLGEQVETAIKDEIFNGRIKPGEQISIDDLSKRLGVSTTPVRDAVKSLDAVGFLRIAPRKGVYVNQPDAKTFREIFEVRLALECRAIETAVGNIPDDKLQDALNRHEKALKQIESGKGAALFDVCDNMVHDLIVEYSSNRRMRKIMDDLRDLIRWARSAVIEVRENARAKAARDHIAILKALIKGDAETAATRLKKHLEGALRDTYKALMTKK